MLWLLKHTAIRLRAILLACESWKTVYAANVSELGGSINWSWFVTDWRRYATAMVLIVGGGLGLACLEYSP